MIVNPKITIITVCYNAESQIEDTILSVVNQSYSNIEYIIVDGASNDRTLDIVGKYRDKISIVVSEPDKGIYDAMNKGIRLATGTWINFMNAGDCFSNDDVVKFLVEEEIDDCGVIFGAWYQKYNNHLSFHSPFPFFENNKKKYRGMGFSHQSVFVKTNLALKYMFDTSFKLCADYNMIWQLYYTEHSFFRDIKIPICIMENQGGATMINYKQHCKEVAKICGCSISSLELFVMFAFHKIKRLVKRILW